MDMLELGMRDQVKPAHRVLEDAHGVSGGTVHPSKSIGRRIRPDGYQAERDGTESLAELLEHGADRRGGVDGFGVVQWGGGIACEWKCQSKHLRPIFAIGWYSASVDFGLRSKSGLGLN
jgi:hypothetical protein